MCGGSIPVWGRMLASQGGAKRADLAHPKRRAALAFPASTSQPPPPGRGPCCLPARPSRQLRHGPKPPWRTAYRKAARGRALSAPVKTVFVFTVNLTSWCVECIGYHHRTVHPAAWRPAKTTTQQWGRPSVKWPAQGSAPAMARAARQTSWRSAPLYGKLANQPRLKLLGRHTARIFRRPRLGGFGLEPARLWRC